MRRVLLRRGRVSLLGYPTLLCTGLVLGVYAQLGAAAVSGLPLARTQAAMLLLVAVGLVGSRLLYLLARRRQGARGSGAVLYGGLLLAVPVSVPVLAALGLPFGTWWDTASFTMLVGVAFGRLGCFLHGCCGGRPTRGWLGLEMPDGRGGRTRRVPVQLLEAGWALALLAGALGLYGRLPFEGALFLCALGGYGAGRLLLEAAREPQGRVLGAAFQRAVSAALVAVALAGFALLSGDGGGLLP